MKIVELKHVSRYYKAGQQKNYALKKVSFDIEEGEFVVILGASGAGKSTMLNLLGGIDRADEGEILVAGEDIAKLSEKELSKYRAKRVGFVFQFYNLIPTLTVKENVELMRELKKDALEAGTAFRRRAAEGIYRKSYRKKPGYPSLRRTHRGTGFRDWLHGSFRAAEIVQVRGENCACGHS